MNFCTINYHQKLSSRTAPLIRRSFRRGGGGAVPVDFYGISFMSTIPFRNKKKIKKSSQLRFVDFAEILQGFLGKRFLFWLASNQTKKKPHPKKSIIIS